MEHPSHKALKPLLAETINEIDTPRTKNLKFLRCKRLSFYGKTMVGSFENNRPNSVKPRASTFRCLANAKMDLQRSSDTINGGEHPLQRDCGVTHQRMLQETSTTDEATCSKCLSGAYISKLGDKLLEDISFPETQKLRHVISWADLFLDKHSIAESIQDSSFSIERPTLDQDAEKRVVQNSRGNSSTYERTENFDLQLLHADVFNRFSSFVASEHCLEHIPPTLLNNSTLSPPSKSLCLTQIAKHNREEKDTVVSTDVSGECGADDHMHQSTRKVSFQNSCIVCKGDDSCTTTMDLHENFATYFWAPLNDSSDEEWPDVKTMSLKPPDLETKEYKNSLKSCDFFKPENMNCFSLLRDKLPSTKRADSCEKWDPGTENLLEIKEYKCKDFTWPLKPDCTNGTNDTVENILELAANGRIPLDHVKKDASRDRMLTFQLLKKDTDQRNEPKLEHVLGGDEVFEERKFTEEQADDISSGANCNRGQWGIELKSLMKDPATQTSSFYKNSLLKLSENSVCKAGSDSFNLSCESAANLCINYDFILEDILPQFGNDSMAHKPNTIPKPVQDYRNENVSEDVIKLVVGPKNNSEKLLNSRVNVDDRKKVLWNDEFSSDSSHADSVLAKYYFYLNFLNESKRLQYEDSNHSFSCQELTGFSKDESISADGCHMRNNRYEHQDTEYMNRASEESCPKDERTEVDRQQGSHSEEQETNLFANSCPKSLADLELAYKRQPGNVHIPKDKMIPETRKTSPEVAGPRRRWQRASIAWSSYTHGELKPRSQHVQRSASANESTRKGSYKAQSLPSSEK